MEVEQKRLESEAETCDWKKNGRNTIRKEDRRKMLRS